MKKTIISKEVGEKLLRWEKEGIMQKTLNANNYILELYKKQIKSETKKLDEKRAKNLISVNKYNKTKKGKKNIMNSRIRYEIYRKTEKAKEIKRIYQQSKSFKRVKKRYNKSEKGKITIKKQNSRRRNKGFNCISFPLSIPYDWHHVNENDVVAIPRNIHKAIPHKCGDGKLEGVLG